MYEKGWLAIIGQRSKTTSIPVLEIGENRRGACLEFSLMTSEGAPSNVDQAARGNLADVIFGRVATVHAKPDRDTK